MMNKFKKIINILSMEIERHRLITLIILILVTLIDVGIRITNPSNIISGISFATCFIGGINLILSKTGHIFLSHDTLWMKLRSKGQEDQYEAKRLKSAKILILIGIPLSVLAFCLEILLIMLA